MNMSVEGGVYETVLCPVCHTHCHTTNWEPVSGFDPCMKQYRCGYCSINFYQIPELNKEAKDGL